MGGDFNEILVSTEKSGGGVRGPGQMAAFSSALSEVGLADLGYVGYPFTWSDNRREPDTVCCLLDRVCADETAITTFPTSSVEHLQHPGSDHISILFHLHRRPEIYLGAVHSILKQSGRGRMIVQRYEMIYKGEACKARLIQWSKARSPAKQIERTSKKLMEL